MKKISKINLKNFRAFYGENEINFNNKDDKPADLVCIYGKNGSGKTSLFDGIEWFFTGDINLLKKDLKNNVAKYTGDILKNQSATEEEKAWVSIEYSDKKSGKRTVTKRHDSENDYGKGQPSGECKNIINEKQILPHSRIDSFVYASKPSDVYVEWGNIWDPDNRWRTLFESAHKVYKEYKNEYEEYESQVQQLEKAIVELNIEEVVNRYNHGVTLYNKMKIEEIPELLPLYYQEKQAIVTSDISDCNNLLPTLYEYIEKKKEIVGKYEYLEANFRNYKVQKQKEQDWTYRIKKWEHIIEMCRGKRNMICEQEKIEDQKLKAEQKKRDLAETFTNDWFENYENYVRNYTQFRSVNETLKNIQVELDKLNESILTSQKQKKDAEKEKIEISLQSKTWKTQLDSIAEQEKVLLKLEQENNLKIDYNLMEQIALYEQELSFLEEMQLGKISPLENSEDQLISWLKNLNETKCKIEENLNSKKEIENILEEEYGQMQEWIGNMETLLALAHKEIEKDNMCVCPICKAKYTDKEELLKRLDISDQQSRLIELKKKLDDAKIEKEKEQKKFDDHVVQMQLMIQEKKHEIESCRDEYQEVLRQKKEKYEQIQNDLQRIRQNKTALTSNAAIELDVPSETISVETIEEISKRTIEKVCSDINEIDRNLETLLEKKHEIERNQKEYETTLEICKKNTEEFECTDNQEKLEQMQKYDIHSSNDWKVQMGNLNREIENYTENLKQLQEKLGKYKIYRTKNIEKYEHLYWLLQGKREETWVMEYEQIEKMCSPLKKLSLKVIRKNIEEIREKTRIVQEKTEIFNRELQNFRIWNCVESYNTLIEKHNGLNEKLNVSLDKQKIANGILKKVQTRLEEYIKDTFGDATINRIYSKIEPHKRFTKLQYKIGFNEKEAPEMYRSVMEDADENAHIMPELFFSSAQLNTVALSIFLGGALTSTNVKLHTLFIDDPIGHFDDLNVLSFIDVLRTIISKTEWQIIISTHEKNFYEMMKVKLNPNYYNSKFFRFYDEGKLVVDEKLNVEGV